MSGSTRTIWIMAATAVVSLGAGLGLSRVIISPAEQAAQAAPPAAGPITVPVERRELSNDVVLRADAVYEDPVSVTLETGDVEGRAIVTGQVPEVGATLEAGTVVLEVAGRPVILLAGELPVYRTLRAGVSGPDVVQLKAALGSLGIAAGDPASDDYDAATAAGVAALYARVGYPAPGAGTEVDERVDAAEEAVAAAQEQLAGARRALTQAGQGATAGERVELDNAVRAAERAVADAQAMLGVDLNGDGRVSDMDQEVTATTLANLQDQVAAAVAARADRLTPPDTSAAQADVTAAQRAVSEAQTELASARRDTLTPLPAGEVVYLASTPRRVDAVEVRRGSTVAGTAVMSVSGATLQLTGTVGEADARLLTVGLPAVVELPSGGEVPATVQQVGGDDPAGQAAPGGEEAASGRTRVVVVPDALTEEQRAELQGANVRVTVPVGATQGEVLAVPTAALTAGPGGEARVEVLDGDESRLVTVTTGLAAGGFVEVSAGAEELAEGDRVVVGTTGSDPGTEPTGEETENAEQDAEDA